MQILVVDDDALASEMIAAVLEDAGYQVFKTENAIEALALLEQEPSIALVISDMNMPFMTGVDLYQELQSQGSQLPFILLTGDDPKAAWAQAPTINACIIKDFSMEETLPAAINDVMVVAS